MAITYPELKSTTDGKKDNLIAYNESVKAAFQELENLSGVSTEVVPVVRTNNPTLAADTLSENIDHLDAAIGADADLTVVTRTTGQVVSNSTVMAKVDALDAAIGADLTPVTRTTGQLSVSNSANANIDALDTVIGADADLTVVTRTTGQLAVNSTIMTKFDVLDAGIGFDAQLSGTPNIVSKNNTIYQNFDAIDTVLGPKNVGAKGAGVTAVTEYGSANYHRTVLTGIDVSEAITNGGTEAINDTIYTFPEGAILVLAVLADLKAYAAISTDVLQIALGSAAADAAAGLSGTEVNIVTATDTTLTTTPGNVCKKAAGPTTAVHDGTTTPITLVLNAAIKEGTYTVGAPGTDTIHVTGNVTILWSFIADYA